MQIGLIVPFDGRPGRTLAELRVIATEAETGGLDSLWFPEHVVFFPTYASRYPYAADGNPGFSRRQGVYDPLFACTVAAGATQRIRVGTSILIVPQRNPVVLAQEVVAVDHASGGRLDLGIGIGWSSEEFEALGVPWERRGPRTDDYLTAMKALWRDELVRHDGEFVRFSNVVAEPKPVQTPHPPLWVAGGRGPAMARAARLGDGWYGFGLAAHEIGPAMRELDAACEQAGRDPATIGRKVGLPFAGTPDELRSYLDAAAAAGVTEVVVAVGHTADHLRRGIEVLGALR